MAKKTASTEKSADKPKASAKKKTAAASSSNAGAVTSLNTDNAALSAAAMLAARAKKALPAAGSSKPESEHFKKLKDSMGKPHISSSSPISGVAGFTPSTASTGFAKQVGHSQIAGNKSSNTGVPRRTSTG